MENNCLAYIKGMYEDYSEMVDSFGEEKISSRIDQIHQEMIDYIDNYGLIDSVIIDYNALGHAVFDYFSDVKRLKDFTKIENVNPVRIKAYETKWLLRRHPIQVVCDDKDGEYAFINERFLLMRILSYMIGEKMDSPMDDKEKVSFSSFVEFLMYYLKFRECNAQTIELMLLAFEAGKVFG